MWVVSISLAAHDPLMAPCVPGGKTSGDHLRVVFLSHLADEGYLEFREAAEQVPHAVCAVPAKELPHTEEEVCRLWLPLRQEKKVLVTVCACVARGVT